MSTAASLAAAKKRRGPQFQQPSQKSNQSEISNKSIPSQESKKSNASNQLNDNKTYETKVEMLNNRQILTIHEKRIFKIECLLKALFEEKKNILNNNYDTKEGFTNSSGENSTSENSENRSEIEKLKKTITNLTKSNAEINIKLAQIKSNLQASNIHGEKFSDNNNNDNDNNDDNEDDNEDDVTSNHGGESEEETI